MKAGPTIRDPSPPAKGPPPGAADEPDWFKRLPEAEQQRLIRRWESKEHHHGVDPARLREMRGDAIRNGAIILALAVCATSFWTSAFGTTVLRVVLAAVVGSAAGALMHKCHLGRFGSAALGAMAWAVTLMITNGFNVGGVMHLVLLFSGLMLATYLFAAIGVANEFRGSV